MSGDGNSIPGVLAQIAEAQRCFVGGNSGPYEDLFEHSEQATLTGPFGGPTLIGWSKIQPRMRRAAAFFGGPVESSSVVLESVDELDGLAVLRLTERNRVRFKGRDEVTDWDLRATLVLRRANGAWRILHRHADPLMQIDTSRRLR